jgi:MFS family permease
MSNLVAAQTDPYSAARKAGAGAAGAAERPAQVCPTRNTAYSCAARSSRAPSGRSSKPTIFCSTCSGTARLRETVLPVIGPAGRDLQAFGIYAVGFVSRPVGAALFGHYGDRIGRKVTLIATVLLTGLSTFAVGFVPSYASIGIWGAVVLTMVRFIQGVGIGGEWGGATLGS